METSSKATLGKSAAIRDGDFRAYQEDIVHRWLRTITLLAVFLVPIFFLLDVLVAPDRLLPTFAVYRGASTAMALAQFLIIRFSGPGKYSYLHGYFISLQVGGVIVLMTTYVGGFASEYYAGLIMVMIGVNLLMPWHARHTAANSLMIVGLYVATNLALPPRLGVPSVTEHLFFLIGTSVIVTAISQVRHTQLRGEFSLLVELQRARDALRNEMELAKDVQVALLPRARTLAGYDLAVSYSPAREVGGDYYDIIETRHGDKYLAIGDVAGHGLDSGLIMMMAQTSVLTTVGRTANCSPAEVLHSVNAALRENIGRLASDHYMTMTVLKLEGSLVLAAGHHQDLLIHRAEENRVETWGVQGSWLGIADSLDGFLQTEHIRLEPNDSVLLFSDGITEARSADGEIFGQDRLAEGLARRSPGKVSDVLEGIATDVLNFQIDQEDDMTLILFKRRDDHHDS